MPRPAPRVAPATRATRPANGFLGDLFLAMFVMLPELTQGRRRIRRLIVAAQVVSGQHMCQLRSIDLVHQRSNLLWPHRHAAQHAKLQSGAQQDRAQPRLERHDTPPRANPGRAAESTIEMGAMRERSETAVREIREWREAQPTARRNGAPHVGLHAWCTTAGV